MPTGGLGAFSNIIIQAFGFTMLQTYLLAIAQGAIIMTFLFSGAYLSKKYNQKIILAIILPPVGVFLERGCGADFFINILLTILGYIPGIIHALYIILKY